MTEYNIIVDIVKHRDSITSHHRMVNEYSEWVLGMMVDGIGVNENGNDGKGIK